jgi:hypothetical protein
MAGSYEAQVHDTATEVKGDDTYSPTLIARGPDKELIIACSKFIDIELRRRRLLKFAITIEAEEIADRELALTAESYDRMLKRLCELRATTFEGLAAKAQALVTVEPRFRFGDLEGSSVGGRILSSMLRDMLALNSGNSTF